MTDQTQGNWNGIVGDIALSAVPAVQSIGRVRIYPDAANRTATVKVLVDGGLSGKTKATVTASPRNFKGRTVKATKPSAIVGDTLLFKLDMGKDARLWSEHHPDLYNVTVTVGDDKISTVMGLRDIAVGTREITVNGIPALMRGTVENCCFPLTGYPPTDVESWMRVFEKCKEYGINMMRFHSYCPPEAAFTAADSVGFTCSPKAHRGPTTV